MKLETCTTTEIDKWVAERHYLRSVPAGARLRLWVLDDTGRRIGAMMWGRPTARSIDQSSVLELTRMVLIDDTEPFAESRALAIARKHIRRHMPEVKGLVAYSSIGAGHEGTIYRADNWFPFGITQQRRKGWSSREARTDRDLTVKTRWMRSP